MSERCGLVAVLGAPNAGKSTLVNALVGQKVAIVSPKAQTTRTRLMGVAIEGDAQILLVDTPGIFEPKRRLDRAMVSAAWGGTEGDYPASEANTLYQAMTTTYASARDIGSVTTALAGIDGRGPRRASGDRECRRHTHSRARGARTLLRRA